MLEVVVGRYSSVCIEIKEKSTVRAPISLWGQGTSYIFELEGGPIERGA